MDALLLVFLLGLILQGIKTLINYLWNATEGFTQSAWLSADVNKPINLLSSTRYNKSQPSGSIAFTTVKKGEPVLSVHSPAPRQKASMVEREVIFMSSTHHQVV